MRIARMLALGALCQAAAAEPTLEIIAPPDPQHLTFFSEFKVVQGRVFLGTAFQDRASFTSVLRVREPGEQSWRTVDGFSASMGVSAVSDDGTTASVTYGSAGWNFWREGSGLAAGDLWRPPSCFNADGTAFGVPGDSFRRARASVSGVDFAFPDAGNAYPTDIAADGSLLCGYLTARPFLWRPGQAPDYLPLPPGEARGAAIQITPDLGSVILECDDALAHRFTLYRRTMAGDTRQLLSAVAIHGDATPICDNWGRMILALEPFPRTASRVWTPATGLMPFDQYLRLHSIDLAAAGLTGLTPWNFSRDGRVMWGAATLAGQPRLWIASGLPAVCPVDFNGDGFVDFFDYAAFTDCFMGAGCNRPTTRPISTRTASPTSSTTTPSSRPSRTGADPPGRARGAYHPPGLPPIDGRARCTEGP